MLDRVYRVDTRRRGIEGVLDPRGGAVGSVEDLPRGREASLRVPWAPALDPGGPDRLLDLAPVVQPVLGPPHRAALSLPPVDVAGNGRHHRHLGLKDRELAPRAPRSAPPGRRVRDLFETS